LINILLLRYSTPIESGGSIGRGAAVAAKPAKMNAGSSDKKRVIRAVRKKQAAPKSGPGDLRGDLTEPKDKK
jgi:hypothetical protein